MINNFSILITNYSTVAGEPGPAGKVLDMNRRQLVAEEAEEGAALSSPNSAISTFQVNFPIYRNGNKLLGKRECEGDHVERWGNSSSRASDEEDGSARKKLRLTKEQSAFLEESFKEHNTLNPVSQTSYHSFLDFLSV